VEDAVIARPRSIPSGRHSHGSPEVEPRVGDAVTAHLRPTSGGRRSNGSSEVVLGWETQPQTSSTFPTRMRASRAILWNVIYIYSVKMNLLAKNANTHCYVNY
jgi:hypothetical protein